MVDFAYEGDVLTKDESIASGRQLNFINNENNVKLTYREFDNYDLPVEFIIMAKLLIPAKIN